jgi:hypothetical protein
MNVEVCSVKEKKSSAGLIMTDFDSVVETIHERIFKAGFEPALAQSERQI